MTNELEKTFFDTFGIEPRVITEPRYSLNSEYYEVTVETYPQITDRILLELFDILRATYNIDFWATDKSFVMDLRDKQASYTNIIYRTGGDFKNSILNSLNIIVKDKLIGNDKIKQQVQSLFKEE